MLKMHLIVSKGYENVRIFGERERGKRKRRSGGGRKRQGRTVSVSRHQKLVRGC